MQKLLSFFIFLSLATSGLGQWKTFSETRTVMAKKREFTCKYSLRYKGALTIDQRKSKVTCVPDSKGKFGTVSQTFEIKDFSVEVQHDVKKGKDTMKKISVSKLTTPSPTTTEGGGGGEGGHGETGGEEGEMSCACKLPMLDESIFAESGRKLSDATAKVLERRKNEASRGHNQSYNNGYAFGSLLQVVVLASFAALAGVGKAVLLQNLGGLIAGRKLSSHVKEREEVEEMILGHLTKAAGVFDRQDLLGGLLGELGGLLGGNGGTEEVGQAVLEQAITDFLTNGGLFNIFNNMLQSEDLFQQVGEAFGSFIGGLNMEETINSLSTQLGSDLGEIVSIMEQALSSVGLSEVLGSMLGGISQQEIEGMMEGIDLNTMEMMMNCNCQKNTVVG